MTASGNGKNRFWIKVVCEEEILDEEWLCILLMLNRDLFQYRDGEGSDVKAILCEDDE